MNKSLVGIGIALAFMAAAPSAMADTWVIDLSGLGVGYTADGKVDPYEDGLVLTTLPAGVVVTDFTFDLNVTGYGPNSLYDLNLWLVDTYDPNFQTGMGVAPSMTTVAGTEQLTGSWSALKAANGGLAGGTPFAVASGNKNLAIWLFEAANQFQGSNAQINYGSIVISYSSPAAVPEPASYALMGFGLLSVAAAVRRRKAV